MTASTLSPGAASGRGPERPARRRRRRTARPAPRPWRSGRTGRASGAQSSSTKVTLMFTRYSEILPFLTTTFCSWIQAPSTFFSVLTLRAIPACRASSKLVGDDAVISVTRATAMAFPPSCGPEWAWPTVADLPLRRTAEPAPFRRAPPVVCGARGGPPMPADSLSASAPSLSDFERLMQRAFDGLPPTFGGPAPTSCSGWRTSRQTTCWTRWRSRIPTS